MAKMPAKPKTMRVSLAGRAITLTALDIQVSMDTDPPMPADLRAAVEQRIADCHRALLAAVVNVVFDRADAVSSKGAR
jgi:hypothetical protein